jgi:threonine/homoserine/homoserine lactone efflux protein
VAALLLFLAYGLGMGAVLMGVTLGAALFKGAVARALKQVVPYVERLSAVLLIAAGGYIVYYWLGALR